MRNEREVLYWGQCPGAACFVFRALSGRAVGAVYRWVSDSPTAVLLIVH